ncbi:DUF1345 domain-containing protein [Kribbella sandramycini]|nr:DUF1345 domain-containing protein [Kribbella sandramycini]
MRVLLAVAGVALVLILWVISVPVWGTVVTLLLWDALAVVFLARQFYTIRRARSTESSWLLPARWMRLRYGALLVASAAGLSSGLLVVTVDALAADVDTSYPHLATLRILAALTVLLAWLTLHTGYAMHYANLYFTHDTGLTFPGPTRTPNLLDFTYFSFTIGTAFATSDTTITTHPLRHAALWHSILAFFYNTAVLGIAITAFTGK